MASRSSWCALALLATTSAMAAANDPLLLTRSANDLEIYWTLDPAATGYHVRRVDSETLISTIDQEAPLLSVGPFPAFPVVVVDGMASPPDLHFYDVRPSGTMCVPGSDRDGDRLD